VRATPIIVLVLVVCASACFAVDLPFNDVLKSYSALHGRRVTLVGLAQVEGSDFFLWDLHDKRHKDPERAIWVLWDTRLPNYPTGSNIAHYTYLNFKPVRVTGLVDTRFHGRHGDIPFELHLQRVEVLPGPRRREFLRDIAVFHNSMPIEIRVRLDSRRSPNESTLIELGPGDYNDTAIEDGLATVTSVPGKPVTKCKISLGGANLRYYDSRQHVYYYDIRGGRMRLVMPGETKYWNLLPMVDRN
jgi:hypothetical protein